MSWTDNKYSISKTIYCGFQKYEKSTNRYDKAEGFLKLCTIIINKLSRHNLSFFKILKHNAYGTHIKHLKLNPSS